jgi:hypothetical protein
MRPVERRAPGHTGEPVFAELRPRYGARYLYAGLASVTAIP